MNSDIQPPLLSDETKGRIYGMLTMGCDWETTAKYLSFTADQLRAEADRDEIFRHEIMRCEAAADLHQIKNMHEAAKDTKNWRASEWWLERTSPVRFAKRPATAITYAEWQQFLETMANAISEEISLDSECKRLQQRLARMTYAIQISHLDDGPSEAEEVED